jgi:dTDP-4-amino-4,6-dideoxygalactose transaminase
VFKTEDREGSYHIYPLRLHGISEDQRDAVIREIVKRQVSVNVHFIPVPALSFYHGMGFKVEDYPVALDNYRREITLPLFYDLSDEQVKTVVSAVQEALDTVL